MNIMHKWPRVAGAPAEVDAVVEVPTPDNGGGGAERKASGIRACAEQLSGGNLLQLCRLLVDGGQSGVVVLVAIARRLGGCDRR
jgi:hypothetical protein